MNILGKHHRFPSQIILLLITIVVVTTSAVGIPAIFIIRSQLNNQAWAQLDQGLTTAQAFYQAKENEVANLAMLTAQRPTLQKLIQSGDKFQIEDYLTTLQGGTDLELIVICDQRQRTVATTVLFPWEFPCKIITEDNSYHLLGNNGEWQLWLTAINPISESGMYVISGEHINDDFVEDIKEETGLDHVIRVGEDEAPVTTTLPALKNRTDIQYEMISQPIPGLEEGRNYRWQGESFFATSFFAKRVPQIKIELLLSTAGIREAQNYLARNLFLSLLGVTLIVSVLGVLVARQISHPLVQLADTATAFSQGNLQDEVTVASYVWEIAQVADALENARVDLLETMTRLQREKKWVEHLLASIVEGIMTMNRKGEITFFSLGAERITGWMSEDVLHRSCDEVFALPESDVSFSQAIPAPGKRRNLLVELAGNRQAMLAFTGAELAPTEVREAQVVLVFRDISEEEAIHRLLGNFMSNIAHEFRTPLSSLAASIELLMDQHRDLTEEENQELLLSLHLGIIDLQALVNNLLEAASIEAGHFQVKPRQMDLGEIIASAVQMMHPLIKKYEQHLSVELPAEIPVVMADRRRIIQVLINYLSNAIKYSPEGGKISIRAEKMGGVVKVEVLDQGPGIPIEEKDTLFRRFVRLESTSKHSDVGAGLGLSVVKEIIGAHGGKVDARNRSAGGAAFSFTLPLAKSKEQ